MCTKEEFRRQVGMVDVNAIRRTSPGMTWGWWKYGPQILCFGKSDWECAIGVIYKFIPDGAFEIFGCGSPGIPPMDDNCIFFRSKDGDYIDEQDSDICSRAWSQLPRTSGRMDGITLGPSIESPAYVEPPARYTIMTTTPKETTPVDSVAVFGLIALIGLGLGALTLATAMSK